MLFCPNTFLPSNIPIAIQKLETQLTLVTPEQISMESSPKGGRRWGWQTHLMMLEFLSHRTPPSCVATNILTVTEIVSPRFNIVKEIFSKNFVRRGRSELAYSTKLLAAYQIAKSTELIAHHSDGTKRRQIDIQNSVLWIAKNGGF